MQRSIVGLSLAILLSAVTAGTLSATEAHDHHGTHKYRAWQTLPPAYAAKTSRRWSDDGAIARGKALYETYCIVCHGSDGRGTTPFANTLEHPPADLTHHFHTRPGEGDAYLFWRVSEGGAMEPFKSAMPAFKTLLREDQRWSVLAYVHAAFRNGFDMAAMPRMVAGRGNVVALLPDRQQIVVDHEKIEGFMEAMTMGYKVDPASLLHHAKPGETILFTIDTRQQTTIKIEEPVHE